MGRTRRMAGFTWVEVIVVLVAGFLLLACLLPTLLHRRSGGPGRRASCLNNLKQIALAMQEYETRQKVYPINWGINDGRKEPAMKDPMRTAGHSWLSYLLADLGSQPLYDRLAFGRPLNYVDEARDKNNFEVAQTSVEVFVCPSDTHEGVLEGQALASSGKIGVTNYKSCAGSNWAYGTHVHSKQKYGITHGRNWDQTDGLDRGDGLICRGKMGAVITEIKDLQDGDGTEFTFAIGEAVPEYCAWSAWYSFDGATATCAIPLNFEVPGTQPRNNAHDYAHNYSFMSRHRGGANFAMCDASGHFISDKIDLEVYRALATIDGGESVDKKDFQP